MLALSRSERFVTQPAHLMPLNKSSSVPILAALASCLLLPGGCVYLPKTTTIYDENCKIMKHHMTLEVHQAATIAGCSNEACVAALVVFGAVSAATAVVSGSVVVVGNVVYWLEKQGQCLNRTGPDEHSSSEAVE
jgi:hypothetical protein